MVISPDNPEYSSQFNPLAEARSDIEREQIAEIIVRAGTPDKKDSFWSQGAIRFISLFLRCLHQAESDEPGVNNLANLYYLFQNFGSDGKSLDIWMRKYTLIADDPDNETLRNERKGLLTGNKE